MNLRRLRRGNAGLDGIERGCEIWNIENREKEGGRRKDLRLVSSCGQPLQFQGSSSSLHFL